jgi:ABC-type transport system involved in cytochrome c biogenesis permease component
MQMDWKNSFPITTRELLGLARRKKTYWDRVLIGGLLLLLACAVVFFNGEGLSRPTANLLFQGAHSLMLLYSLLAGAHTTFDTISSEKREGTLGLLYLSNMSPLEIIFGKLTTATLQTVFGLMVCLPLLAVPILTGGVTMQDCARTLAACLNLLFFSSAAGIFSSVVCRKKGFAGLLAALLLTIFVVIPTLMLVTRYYLWAANPWILLLVLFNFGTTFVNPAHLGFSEGFFWSSIICTQCLSWIWLFAAVLLFPRAIQEKPAAKARGFWHGWNHFWTYGPSRFRSMYRLRSLDQNAFAWLASRNWMLQWKLAFAFGASAFALQWLIARTDWSHEDRVGTMLLALAVAGIAIKMMVAFKAGQQLSAARNDGSMEWLLTTPLTAPGILGGQLKAILRQLAWTLALWYSALIYLILIGWSIPGVSDSMLISVTFGCFFGIDIVALTYLGAWTAIVSRESRTAGPDAISRGVLLPAVIASFAIVPFSGLNNFKLETKLSFWFAIIGMINVCWIFYIKKRFAAKLVARAQGDLG